MTGNETSKLLVHIAQLLHRLITDSSEWDHCEECCEACMSGETDCPERKQP